MTIQEYFLWFDDVLRTTEGMYKLVPADKLDWKPTENSFSLGQLIEHMPKAFWFNSKVIASEEWPLKSLREILVSNRRHPAATPDEALKHLGEFSSGFKGAIEKLGEEKFQRDVVNTPQWGTLPIWRFAIFVLEHHLNHKMELHMYLKLLGVKVNTGTLYAGERARSVTS
ncbi:MAG: DinB family protein [Bacteroidetes bacterium]|nr:DinB family protein [Bacteroidota bacterium]